jgi:LSD1 subclass zinc finger protein
MYNSKSVSIQKDGNIMASCDACRELMMYLSGKLEAFCFVNISNTKQSNGKTIEPL